MNGIYLYFVNKQLSSWPPLGLKPFPNKPLILHVCSASLLKTLCEKEKLLVTSNFSFSQYFLPFQRTFHRFLSNSKLSSANSFSLEESKICRLGRSYVPFSPRMANLFVDLRPLHVLEIYF